MMKSFIGALLILIALHANSQVYRMEINASHVVLTDTTSGAIKPVHKEDLRFEILSGRLSLYSVSFNRLVLKNHLISQLVNFNDVAFTESTITKWLIAFTGPSSYSTGIQASIYKIYKDYGDIVDINDKAKELFKFGRNDDLETTEETVWLRGGIETYPTTNPINRIVSSDDTDTQIVTVEGHTISGTTITFSSVTDTLTGQTEETLNTSLYRATRIFNNDDTDFAGTIYVYESGGTVTNGVPQDATKIHLQAPTTTNQSLKGATTLSSVDYWLITEGIFSVSRTQTRVVDFKIKIREFGKVFRQRVNTITVNSSQGTVVIPFDPPIVVRSGSDIRVDASSSGITTTVDVGLNGHLAIVQ